MDTSHGGEAGVESAASKHLRDLLHKVKATSSHAAILLVGPSGTGKSTLARTALLTTNFQVRTLDFRVLCHDDPVTTIANILAAFKPKQDGGAIAVVLDDIDFWAPAPRAANPVTGIEIRIIAALNDALKNISEVVQPFAFIATACDENAVHPALRCPGRLRNVVRLYPLSVVGRITLAEKWIRHHVKDDMKWHSDMNMIARQIALVTPGFVHADFSRFFSLIEGDVSAILSDSQADVVKRLNAVFTGANLSAVLGSVVPSLLTSAGGASSLILNRSSTSQVSLYGLDSEIQQFRECITSVFASSIHQGPVSTDPQQEATMEIMKNLGSFRGIILHGPTGSGKTAMTTLAPLLLPKHTVNFLRIDATSIVSSVIGEAEQKLTQLFAVANAIAPTLLVVENIDILAPNRDLSERDGGSAAQAFHRLLSTFLTQIDGVQRGHEGAPVFILATTRSLRLIDTALLRPGRLEIHIELHPPDALSRLHILKTFLSSKHVELQDSSGNNKCFDEDKFVATSEGWTAPDLFSYGRRLLVERRFGKDVTSDMK